MIILSLIIIITGIVGYYLYTKKIPKSISSAIYDIPISWVWSVWLIFIGMLTTLILFSVLTNYTQFLSFLLFIFITGAAVTPLVQKETHTLHDIMSILAGVVSQIIVLIINPWLFIVWILYAIGLIYFRNYLVLVSEICCILSLYGSILI